MLTRLRTLAILFFPLISSGIASTADGDSLREVVSFRDEIKPLLAEKCVHCHNRKTLPDLFSFESAKQAFVTMKSGQKVIVPGEPSKSVLIIALQSPLGHEKAMPMVGPRPTEDDIKMLRQWIEEGADWPKGPAGKIRPTFYAKE